MRIVADDYIPYVNNYFRDEGELILKPGRAITASDTKDADILLVRSITPVNARLLQGSSVKFVGSVTAGADHLDKKWLTRQGIDYCTAAGFNAPPVADFVMSVIAALRQSKKLAQKFKAAVIGVGHVGKLVVERLKAFDCEIICCDPLRAEVEPNFTSTPLTELADVDFISLHVPLSHDCPYPTYHFINQAFLQRQKPGCVLLNTSRGAVIDADVLLKYGKHLIWCMDVWENEPEINKQILAEAFIATPHIAGYSKQSKIRGIDMIYHYACQIGMIAAKVVSPIEMPTQTLHFRQAKSWQAVLLGIFNPQLMTTLMSSTLLEAADYGPLFDGMRNQFNYRHEFCYTSIYADSLKPDDKALLRKMGLMIGQHQ